MRKQGKSITRRKYLASAGSMAIGAAAASFIRPAIGAAPVELVMPFSLGVELGLPMMIAVAKGFSDEHGIKVTHFVAGPGTQIRAGLIAKQYDFAAVDWSHVPIARVAGSPLRCVMALTERSNQTLLVRYGLNDKVKAVEDLKGYNIGCSAPGSSSWTNAKLTLDKTGLSPDRDYNLIILGGDTGVITTALKTGRVDAFSAWEPITSISLKEKIAFPLVPAWDLAAQEKFYGSKQIAALILATHDGVINTKPDLVKRMVATHQQALSFIHENTAENIVDAVFSNPVSAESFSGLGRDVLTAVVGRTKSAFGSGCISKAGFESQMQRMVNFKVLPRGITFQEYADTSFGGLCS